VYALPLVAGRTHGSALIARQSFSPRPAQTSCSPNPRLDACRLGASDWVDAEVSSDARRSAGPTKAEVPGVRVDGGAKPLLLADAGSMQERPCCGRLGERSGRRQGEPGAYPISLRRLSDTLAVVRDSPLGLRGSTRHEAAGVGPCRRRVVGIRCRGRFSVARCAGRTRARHPHRRGGATAEAIGWSVLRSSLRG